MNHAGTLWAGYGISIVAVLGYVAWLLRRARVLGDSLEIALNSANDPAASDSAKTQETGNSETDL